LWVRQIVKHRDGRDDSRFLSTKESLV